MATHPTETYKGGDSIAHRCQLKPESLGISRS